MNKKDKTRYRKLSEMGCIICRLFHDDIYTPPDLHHLISYPKKDNQRTIPLCPPHHRKGVNCDEYVSRHPWETEFESRYKPDEELLLIVNELLEGL